MSEPRTRSGVLETDSLCLSTPLRQGFGGQAPGWRHAALLIVRRPQNRRSIPSVPPSRHRHRGQGAVRLQSRKLDLTANKLQGRGA